MNISFKDLMPSLNGNDNDINMVHREKSLIESLGPAESNVARKS